MAKFDNKVKVLSLILLVTLLPTAFAARYSEDGLPPDWKYHNYYDPNEKKELLKNVNAYHLIQGTEKMFKGQGHYQYAYGDFAFMLHYFPNHPQALELMGQLSLLMNQPEIGEDYYKKAFELYPKSIKPQTYVDYGKFLYKAGKMRESNEACKTALSMNPNMTEAHYYIGLTYFASKDYKLANEHAQRAYAKGFKETELRDKLMSVKAWAP